MNILNANLCSNEAKAVLLPPAALFNLWASDLPAALQVLAFNQSLMSGCTVLAACPLADVQDNSVANAATEHVTRYAAALVCMHEQGVPCPGQLELPYHVLLIVASTPTHTQPMPIWSNSQAGCCTRHPGNSWTAGDAASLANGHEAVCNLALGPPHMPVGMQAFLECEGAAPAEGTREEPALDRLRLRSPGKRPPRKRFR